MDRRAEEGKPIPFFGKDKTTTIIPAKLAVRFDCDLIPARVERLGGARFRVTFYPPVRPQNPSDCESDQAIDMIRQVNQLFESCGRRLDPATRSKIQSASHTDHYAPKQRPSFHPSFRERFPRASHTRSPDCPVSVLDAGRGVAAVAQRGCSSVTPSTGNRNRGNGAFCLDADRVLFAPILVSLPCSK